jgi:hypothetical protein
VHALLTKLYPLLQTVQTELFVQVLQPVEHDVQFPGDTKYPEAHIVQIFGEIPPIQFVAVKYAAEVVTQVLLFVVSI